MTRRGDWMVTATGGQYWPLDPRPADVSITDIGMALSKLCRFGGHSSRFYSVAEHSVLVSHVVPAQHARQGLMHDATEAYVVDVPRPLKRGLGATYADLEHLNWLAICSRFLLAQELHEDVHAADNAVLLAERNALLIHRGHAWTLEVPPADVVVRGLDPEAAYRLFMERFYELFPEA